MSEPPYEIFSACRRRDFPILKLAIKGLQTHAEPQRIIVATPSADMADCRRLLGTDAEIVDEDTLIPGMTIADLRRFHLQHFPRAAGWYYQQLLKMAWALRCQCRYYLIWDADTILLKPLKFFTPEGKVLITQSDEHHPPYFVTYRRLFDTDPQFEYSFISQHLMVEKAIMQEMLGKLEKGHSASLNWAYAIMDTLPIKGDNHFSEYETYGHYMKNWHPTRMVMRRLSWLREGSTVAEYPPRESSLDQLSSRYHFVAFEAKEQGIQKLKHLLWKVVAKLRFWN